MKAADAPGTAVAAARGSRVGAPLAWLALFVAALLVRAQRFGVIFVGGHVTFPYAADELYHMRRIWFTVVNFPATLHFDFYMNHPVGAPPHWSPLFDWGIAALARVLVGRGDQVAVEVVAAWVPPVIGAFAVLAAAWLARRTFSRAAGWATGALLVVLPAHVGNSTLGLVDHHVAVGLLATLLVASAMRLAEKGGVRAALATGALFAAALVMWAGALLQVVVVQAFLVAQLLATAKPPAAIARARDLAAAHALAALLLLPFCVGNEWPDFGPLSPWVLSDFQPLWLGAGAATFAAVAWLWSRTPLGASLSRRIGSGAGLALLGLGACWLGVPGLPDAIRNAAGFFESDPFLRRIAELTPLLYPHGSFSFSLANEEFSYLFWLYPLAVIWLGARAVAHRRADVLLLLFTATAFWAATLRQERFTDVAAQGFALVVAPAIVDAFATARRRLSAPRAVWAGAVVALAALALSPELPGYVRNARASFSRVAGEPVRYQPGLRQALTLRRLAEWLRRNTPTTEGYLDASKRPRYGVLASWDVGHQLRYYGERPMVQDNFGPWGGRAGFEAARRYFESPDEEGGVAIAERLGVRYVVASLAGSGQSPPTRGSLALRLALARNRAGMLSFRGASQAALARHRLVFVADDADLVRGKGEAIWTAAVYEIVRGAHVIGRGPAERAVQFEVDVPLPGRDAIRYRATAWTDDSGRYEIRLPYPSEAGYQVRSGSRSAGLRVTEEDVREGRRVAGPSFE